MTAAPLLLLLLLLAAAVRADVVYLRNGNQMEGKVTAETRRSLTIDFGYGTTDIDKSEVLRVERTRGAGEQKELERRRFDAGIAVPPGDEKLDRLFRVVQGKRRKALEARQRRAELEEEDGSLREQLPEELARYEALNRELAGLNPRADPARYNSLITDVNATGASVHADQARQAALRTERADVDKVVNDYMSSYRELDDYLRGDGKALLAHRSDYTDWLRGEIKDMAGDFKRDTISGGRSGNGVFVAVTLNGNVTGRFLVDTGAETTLLYKEIAAKLALPDKAVVAKGQAKVADGRSVQATEVRLDSMAVGHSRVAGAPAIVVAIGDQGFDGLLGMSFLGKFVSRVDLANGRLILEDLK